MDYLGFSVVFLSVVEFLPFLLNKLHLFRQKSHKRYHIADWKSAIMNIFRLDHPQYYFYPHPAYLTNSCQITLIVWVPALIRYRLNQLKIHSTVTIALTCHYCQWLLIIATITITYHPHNSLMTSINRACTGTYQIILRLNWHLFSSNFNKEMTFIVIIYWCLNCRLGRHLFLLEYITRRWKFSDQQSEKKTTKNKIGMVKYIIRYHNFLMLGNICK